MADGKQIMRMHGTQWCRHRKVCGAQRGHYQLCVGRSVLHTGPMQLSWLTATAASGLWCSMPVGIQTMTHKTPCPTEHECDCLSLLRAGLSTARPCWRSTASRAARSWPLPVPWPMQLAAHGPLAIRQQSSAHLNMSVMASAPSLHGTSTAKPCRRSTASWAVWCTRASAASSM